jgi:ATP-binding cassette subfamily F protein uup
VGKGALATCPPNSGATDHTKNNVKTQRELEQLPLQIEQLEKTIKHLHLKMLEPEFYQQTPQDMVQFNTELATQEKQLSAHYLRWEALEDKHGKN